MLAWGMSAVALSAIAAASVLAAINPPISTTEAPESALSGFIWVASWIGFGLVGALVISSRPRNRIGWLLVGITFSLGLTLFASAYARYALVTNPDPLPLGPAFAWLASWLSVAVPSLAVLLILSFPSGDVSTSLGRYVLRLFLALAAVDALAFAFRPGPVEGDTPPNNPLGIEGAGPVLNSIVEAMGTALAILGLLAVIDLAIRFRQARGAERQQFRWFVAAVATFPILFLSAIFLEEQVIGYEGFDPVVLAFFLCGNGVAVAIGVAITRHGLYEIDRIISRTVSYGLLTAATAGIYLGAVSLLSSILPTQGQVAVAGSTLLTAAVFNPLRRRLQVIIDRRFNRARFDREATLEEFSRRLANELALRDVATELVALTRTAMEPAQLSVWLRDVRLDRPSGRMPGSST